MTRHLIPASALAGLLGFAIAGAQAGASDLRQRVPADPQQSRILSVTKSTLGDAPIWGAGAAVGASDGQFANPFVEAGSFAAGDNPTSWTALSVFEASGSVTPGAAF